MDLYKINLGKASFEKEWLLTNKIGGYASSTIALSNKRRYHGLMVAPLNKPASRYLVLSKVDESVEILTKDFSIRKKYNLFSQNTKNLLIDNTKYLVKFSQKYYPQFVYRINEKLDNLNNIKVDIVIKKTIVMKQEANVIYIKYEIQNNSLGIKDEEIFLNISPVINFRNFHYINNNPYIVDQKNISKKDINDNLNIQYLIEDRNNKPLEKELRS